MRNFNKFLHLLKNDPGYFPARLASLVLPLKGSRLKTIHGVRFCFDMDRFPIMKQMYCRVYERDIIKVLRLFLKPGDVFLDVGANIGYISAIALGLVSEQGAVHSFEPVPAYFTKLSELKENNPLFRHTINQVAASRSDGDMVIQVFGPKNIGWNTLVPDFMREPAQDVSIKTTRLDAYIQKNKLDKISVIKIDVEGFEFPVLEGLSNYFASTQNKPVIICEVVPSAYVKLNSSLAALRNYMDGFGYCVKDIQNKKKVDLVALTQTTDVLFLPR